MNFISMLAVLAVLQSAHAEDKTARPSPVAATAALEPVPVVTPAAMRIASSLANEDIVRQATARLLRDQIPKALGSDPDFQKMEQRWPGVTGEFVAAMEPIIIDATITRLPMYQLKIAALFDKRMNSAELESTADFYASPTGKRVLILALQGMDYGSILKQQIASGNKSKISSGDIGALAQSAAIPAVTQLNPAEMKVLVAFGTSPAGLKVNQMRPEIEQLAARETNASDPAVEAKIAEAVKALLARRSSPAARK